MDWIRNFDWRIRCTLRIGGFNPQSEWNGMNPESELWITNWLNEFSSLFLTRYTGLIFLYIPTLFLEANVFYLVFLSCKFSIFPLFFILCIKTNYLPKKKKRAFIKIYRNSRNNGPRNLKFAPIMYFRNLLNHNNFYFFLLVLDYLV